VASMVISSLSRREIGHPTLVPFATSMNFA
jgi:hypothetical protein